VHRPHDETRWHRPAGPGRGLALPKRRGNGPLNPEVHGRGAWYPRGGLAPDGCESAGSELAPDLGTDQRSDGNPQERSERHGPTRTTLVVPKPVAVCREGEGREPDECPKSEAYSLEHDTNTVSACGEPGPNNARESSDCPSKRSPVEPTST
jgi:hypothetical protein